MEKILNQKIFHYFKLSGVWQLFPLFATGVVYTVEICHRRRWHGWQIYCRYRWHRAANLPPVSTTLAKLVAKFAAGVVDTGGKISWHCPFNIKVFFLYLSINSFTLFTLASRSRWGSEAKYTSSLDRLLLNYEHNKFKSRSSLLLQEDSYTVKKGYKFSRLRPGFHLPNSPLPGIIKLFPGVW